MGLRDELKKEVRGTFTQKWDSRSGYQVPDPEDLALSNECVNIEGTVLYADLAESTKLVETETPKFAAKIYKTYLHCASKIIKRFDGEITAFDGDRIMAVFIGDSKNTNAIRAALAINYAVIEIINPILKEIYVTKSYEVNHGIGIDTGELMVARTGVRGSNDLVWVGNAANYAAKLSALRSLYYSIWITDKVYTSANESVKKSNPDKHDMWEKGTWAEKQQTIYKSSWRRPLPS